MLGQGFGETLSEETLALERTILELDRSIAAYDGELMVGTAAIYSHSMTLPGGSAPVAGVTLTRRTTGEGGSRAEVR